MTTLSFSLYLLSAKTKTWYIEEIDFVHFFREERRRVDVDVTFAFAFGLGFGFALALTFFFFPRLSVWSSSPPSSSSSSLLECINSSNSSSSSSSCGKSSFADRSTTSAFARIRLRLSPSDDRRYGRKKSMCAASESLRTNDGLPLWLLSARARARHQTSPSPSLSSAVR